MCGCVFLGDIFLLWFIMNLCECSYVGEGRRLWVLKLCIVWLMRSLSMIGCVWTGISIVYILSRWLIKVRMCMMSFRSCVWCYKFLWIGLWEWLLFFGFRVICLLYLIICVCVWWFGFVGFVVMVICLFRCECVRWVYRCVCDWLCLCICRD